MPTSRRTPTLRLSDYYLVEGANAFAVTLFMLTIFFWAQARFGYTHIENLALGAVQGAAHIIGSRIGGRLGDRIGYNRVVIASLSVAFLIMALGWWPTLHLMPFLVCALYGVFIASIWPVLEAGAMHIPARLNMPQRLGIYNLVWSFSGLTGFVLSGFIFNWNIHSIFWVPAVVHAGQLIWILYHLGRHAISGEPAMDLPHEGNRVPPAQKRELMHFSWLSNSLAYFLGGGFSALTPHLGERFALSQSWTIWLGCSLLLARGLGFVIITRWKGWHYHRGWSLYALWSAPLWLGVIFFTGDLVVAAAGCLLLGFSFGLSYYMSIYYSLDASENKGQQGGYHESIIGLGMLAGPLAGAAGGHFTGSTLGAKWTIILLAFFIATAGYLAIVKSGRRSQSNGDTSNT